MDAPVWLSIGSILTSSAVAIAAVWLAARFASKQAHIGRVWERKAEAYGAILEALHEMLEWFSREFVDEVEGRETDEETQKQRNSDYAEARKLLRRSIARQVWLLPDDVQERVAAMNKALAERQESWFDHIDTGHAVVKKALSDIEQFADRDLVAPKADRAIEKR